MNDLPALHDLDMLISWSSYRVPGREARLRRVPALFAYFQDLIDSLPPTITVTGSSGKGSVCAILESVFRAAGYSTGVFTSPHFITFQERIRIDGVQIPLNAFNKAIADLAPRLRAFVSRYGSDYHPALFECLLLISMAVYREAKCDIAVFEAAIGGSNDATSFLPADVSVITAVGLDHCQELGPTISSIAQDKAGIAPIGGALILGAGIDPEALAMIESVARERHVSLTTAQPYNCRLVEENIAGQVIDILDAPTGTRIRIPSAGHHQLRNLATSICCARFLTRKRGLTPIDDSLGHMSLRLPGRLEFLSGSPSWLLDVAHNPMSICALTDVIQQYCRKEQLVAVVGATAPHDYHSMISRLGDFVRSIGTCGGFPRAINPQALYDVIPAACGKHGKYESPSDCVRDLISNSAPHQTIIVTGSLFLVGAVREMLRERGLISAAGRECDDSASP